MASTINASTTAGIVLTPDTSGEIAFQSAGVTKAGVNATGLTGDASQLTSLTSGNLTGALPAIDGSALTSLTSGNLTGALPAIDGSALTGLPAPAELSTASGSAPSYSARAWVNFNGTGTVAIRASGNVSSITDNGTGNYTVNFTAAMVDVNYAFVGNIGYPNSTGGANNRTCQTENASRSTASIRALTGVASSSTLEDQPGVFVSIFR